MKVTLVGHVIIGSDNTSALLEVIKKESALQTFNALRGMLKSIEEVKQVFEMLTFDVK